MDRSTQKKNGPITLALVVMFGFASVFLGRWLDFATTESVFVMAADAGFDQASIIDRNLTAGALGFVLCLIVQQVRDIKGQVATAMFAAYAATLMMEGQFVLFAPQLFEMVYAPAEIDVIRESTN